MFSHCNLGPPSPGDGRPDLPTPSEYRVLDVLWERPLASAENVASRLIQDLGDVRGILAGLEDAGLVSSTPTGSVNRILRGRRSCKPRTT